jgi:hypothetical protein
LIIVGASCCASVGFWVGFGISCTAKNSKFSKVQLRFLSALGFYGTTVVSFVFDSVFMTFRRVASLDL